MRVRTRRALTAAVVSTLAAAVGAATAAFAITANAATAGCSVSYTVTSQWSGAFGTNIVLTNLGDPVTSWTLTWSFTAGQQVTQFWNTALTQTGAQVSAANADWNGNLATNGQANFG